ncbi:MAG: hypothetical protein ACREJ3_12480 [Polyangiaceae bacterium]
MSALTPAPASAPASASTCRVVRGPIELPDRAAATLAVQGDTMDAVVNDDGHPRVFSYSAGASRPLAAEVREAIDGGAPTGSRGLAIPCAVASAYCFCPDRSGEVHRTELQGGSDRVVASARSRTRVAAAILSDGHPALAYLASRKTSEGWVSEAWLAVDDAPPVRLSEDGSGATEVALIRRGESLLAVMVDARAALTAVHARLISYEAGTHIGEDIVVFVGSPGDGEDALALAVPASGPALALLPLSQGARGFGLAMIRIDDPPRVDEETAWSMYENGINPALVAAVAGPKTSWVARIRPLSAAASSPAALELGEVRGPGAAGASVFTSHGVIAAPTSVRDIGLALDHAGDLWVSWLDASGGWIERLRCP